MPPCRQRIAEAMKASAMMSSTECKLRPRKAAALLLFSTSSPPRPTRLIGAKRDTAREQQRRLFERGLSISRSSACFPHKSEMNHQRGERSVLRQDAEIKEDPCRPPNPRAPLLLSRLPSPPWPASKGKNSRGPPEIGASAHLLELLPSTSLAAVTPHQRASPGSDMDRI
jgi:hypothetical protein